ncbi:hypothetical protein V6N13_057440 [Hibiscus sabdariffa]
MSNPPGMVGRRVRKRMSGAANDSTTKFPISGKVPLEWLMHRLASPSPGHAQSVGGGGARDPNSANHSRLWSCCCTFSLALCYLPRHCHSQYWQTLRGNSIGGCE